MLKMVKVGGLDGKGMDRHGEARQGKAHTMRTTTKGTSMSTETGYENLSVHIRGIAPLILHNGLLSDPLDQRSQALVRAVKDNKKKTIATQTELARVEFLGSLYVDDDGEPCIPGEVIEAMIRTGAKASKEGKSVQQGMICEDNAKIIYDGPKNPEELWASRGSAVNEDNPMSGRRFVDRRRVKVGQAAVMRTRPVFHQWELKFTLSYDPNVMNKKSLIEFVQAAGRSGLCEMRPRFGRFEVVKIS